LALKSFKQTRAKGSVEALGTSFNLMVNLVALARILSEPLFPKQCITLEPDLIFFCTLKALHLFGGDTPPASAAEHPLYPDEGYLSLFILSLSTTLYELAQSFSKITAALPPHSDKRGRNFISSGTILGQMHGLNTLSLQRALGMSTAPTVNGYPRLSEITSKNISLINFFINVPRIMYNYSESMR
jgi:hypothetical protein